jgi:hypothetical protein
VAGGRRMEPVDKELAHKNSIKFFKSLFFECPECGDDQVYIDKVEKDHFITQCNCTRWRVDFKISEE